MKNLNTNPFLLLFFIANSTTLVAQNHDAVLSEQPQTTLEQPNLLLKYSLTSLIEPTPTVQFAVEHRIGVYTSLQHEIGYITSYAQPNLHDYWGVRVHTEYRKYFSPLQYAKRNTYIAFELMGKFNQSLDEYWYCRDACQYSQQILRFRRRVSVGAAFEYGWTRLYQDRFLLDIVTGIGVKHAQIVFDNLEPDLRNLTRDNTNNLFFSNLLSDMAVSPISVNLILGIKIGYVLK
jgi:hypothetical protein